MGFFSKIFGHNGDKGEKHPNLEFYEEVVDNIIVSEALKSELRIKLKQSFENPKSFYDDKNEFILSERGLRYPKDILLTPKFVLIDTLENNDQMAEVDWKETEEEIRSSINRIIKAKNYSLKLNEDNRYDDTDTFEIIKSINDKELNPLGYYLEILDINSDSYVFTVVPLDQHQVVKKIFEKLR